MFVVKASRDGVCESFTDKDEALKRAAGKVKWNGGIVTVRNTETGGEAQFRLVGDKVCVRVIK